ncbi:MAG: hypothetical protein QXL51_00165 [Candidatus Aenigmatarchaeota archaeon]
MYKKAQKLKEEIELLLREKAKLEGELSFLEKEWSNLVHTLNLDKNISRDELLKELQKLNEELKELEDEFNKSNIRE